MPPCQKCGQTTTDDDGRYNCAKCEIRFRFDEGGGFSYAGNAERPTNLAKDWPKWAGVRRGERPMESLVVDLDLPQFAGTRRQNLLVDMYMRWRERLAACGKTLFATLEQRGFAVLLVTEPLDSHWLTPCAAELLMPKHLLFRPKANPVRYAFGGTFPRDE